MMVAFGIGIIELAILCIGGLVVAGVVAVVLVTSSSRRDEER
jgi:hypothetical protein